MAKITADALASDILARQGVPGTSGSRAIWAECSDRQTAYLFDLIPAEKVGRVGGTEYGPRVGHGEGWTLSELKFGRGLLRADSRDVITGGGR